jgi:hypothetical protein
MSAQQIFPLSNTVPKRMRYSPFLPGHPIAYECPSNVTVHATLYPRTDSATRSVEFYTDGTNTVYALPHLDPTLVDTTANASLTVANQVDTAILVNGEPIARVGHDNASPGAGTARVWNDGGTVKVTLGTNYGAGTKVQVMLDCQPVSFALTAHVPAEHPAYDQCIATGANAFAFLP